MQIAGWVRARTPNWVIVMGMAGMVGAVSAILSVSAYREVSTNEMAIPIESEVSE